MSEVGEMLRGESGVEHVRKHCRDGPGGAMAYALMPS